MVGSGQGQYLAHLIMTEDVRQEHRVLHRCQRMFWYIARRIMAATEQAKLPHDAELVAKRDGFASGDSSAPSCDHGIELDLAVIAPALRDKPNEAIENELAAPVRDPHCTLEAQELLRIPVQPVRRHSRHVGTGREMSRSVSVAI